MCGIVGGVTKSHFQREDWIKESLSALRHRGPDEEGMWMSNDQKVVLGHRRLSIVDLNSSSSQPMTKDSFHIVFNGEIYNYQEIRNELFENGISLNSVGDTEVVLASYMTWGTACLDKFKGMFAFVVYDERKNELFAARDRAGEKPFYYFLDENQFFFGSELKSILKAPGKELYLDKTALNSYLSIGFAPGSQCLVEGFNKLKSGHYLTLDLNDWTHAIEEYWSLPKSAESKEMSRDQIESKTIELLQNSIRDQLKADVPVGVLLSGGLDSSIVAALASKESENVKTFSIGFDVDSKYDETPYAKKVASYLGTEHTVLKADKNVAAKLSEFIKHVDEPIMDSSMFPTWLVTNLVKQHCTVALGGDGGDELFGGYKHYSRLLRIAKYSKFIPLGLRKVLRKLIIKLIPIGFRGRRYFIELFANFETEIPRAATYLYQEDIKRLLKFETPVTKARKRTTKDYLYDLLRLDFIEYLQEDILVKVDRMSMMNSLELRAPFLDHELVSFAFEEIPSKYKVKENSSKVLLKQIGLKFLPPNFNVNRKQGFSIPIDSWMRNGYLRDLCNKYVLENRDSIFRTEEINKILSRHDRGYKNGELLLGLTFLEMWRNEYGISVLNN